MADVFVCVCVQYIYGVVGTHTRTCAQIVLAWWASRTQQETDGARTRQSRSRSTTARQQGGQGLPSKRKTHGEGRCRFKEVCAGSKHKEQQQAGVRAGRSNAAPGNGLLYIP